MFDEETLRSARAISPVDFERETDLMPPRKPHDESGKMSGWGMRNIPIVEVLAQLSKINPLWFLTLALSAFIGSAAYPAAQHSGPFAETFVESRKLDNRSREEDIEEKKSMRSLIEKQGKMMDALMNDRDVLVANERDSLKFGKMVEEQLSELRKEISDLKGKQ